MIEGWKEKIIVINNSIRHLTPSVDNFVIYIYDLLLFCGYLEEIENLWPLNYNGVGMCRKIDVWALFIFIQQMEDIA